MRETDPVAGTDDDAQSHQILVRALGPDRDLDGDEIRRRRIGEEPESLILTVHVGFTRVVERDRALDEALVAESRDRRGDRRAADVERDADALHPLDEPGMADHES